MNYFYCPPTAITAASFVIDGEEFSHLVHVMRVREGEMIRLVDGAGNAYDARIESLKQHAACGILLRRYRAHHEPALRLTLGVGMLKNPAKFDFLVEKVTELGAVEIVPLQTERTIASHAKVDRWQKLALAAMKQAGRSFLPVVRPPMTLEELLTDRDRFAHRYLAHEQPLAGGGAPVLQHSRGDAILFLIGPEGGFSEEEVEAGLRSGCRPWYFGSRRLRTETAAVVAAATILLPPMGSVDLSGGIDGAADDGEDLGGAGTARPKE